MNISIKAILYCLFVPLVVWALNSVNMNAILKKNQYYAARLFYLLLVMSISYLSVNFFYDFFEAVRFI